MAIAFFLFVLILFIYIFLLAPTLSRRDRTKAYKGTLFAHRGYHSIEAGVPENSIPAFKAAVKRGYGIEFDLHITKDDKIIIFHDDDLMRICGVKGRPEDFTYDQLKTLRLQGTDERIPLLTDLLRIVKGKVPLLVEFKLPTKDDHICEVAYEILQRYHGPYLMESFNPVALHWFSKYAPEVLRGQLSDNLLKSDHTQPVYVRFMAKHLLFNFYGRPDFISYKLQDVKGLSIWILRKILSVPFAVWTCKTPRTLRYAKRKYEMPIFEHHGSNYQGL